MSGQLEMPGMNPWACDECHDTGRILEVWGWTSRNQYGTAGKAYGCPKGCTRRHDLALPHERIIKHEGKPIVGAAE